MRSSLAWLKGSLAQRLIQAQRLVKKAALIRRDVDSRCWICFGFALNLRFWIASQAFTGLLATSFLAPLKNRHSQSYNSQNYTLPNPSIGAIRKQAQKKAQPAPRLPGKYGNYTRPWEIALPDCCQIAARLLPDCCQIAARLLRLYRCGFLSRRNRGDRPQI